MCVALFLVFACAPYFVSNTHSRLPTCPSAYLRHATYDVLRRIAGKKNVFTYKSKPTDPYGLLLSSRDKYSSLQRVYSSCGKNHVCPLLPFADDLAEDNFVGAEGITVLRRKPSEKPWFLQVTETLKH